MSTTVHLSVETLEVIVERVVRRTLDDSFEDLEALASPSYLASIRRARRDVAAGQTVPLRDVELIH